MNLVPFKPLDPVVLGELTSLIRFPQGFSIYSVSALRFDVVIFTVTELIFQFDNVPTVKVQEGYYEVMQKGDDDRPIPILRLPIQATNMRIIK